MSMISKQVKELNKYRYELEKYGGDFNNQLSKEICDAISTIESLSAKLAEANMERSAVYYNGGWIVTSERIPEESGYYLCTIFCNDGRILVKTIYFNHLHMWIEDCEDVIEPPAAWMSLPDPYKEKQ